MDPGPRKIPSFLVSIDFFRTYHTYAEIYVNEDRNSAVVSYWLVIRVVVAWLEENVKPGK